MQSVVSQFEDQEKLYEHQKNQRKLQLVKLKQIQADTKKKIEQIK
jgi:hypothetical protein